ncbi:MAG: glycine--tRNA ligase subunit beta [candidate division WOR-3 bacterium]|nr:glycine--tRNA ligase subunit beta [candidate division WOR-3 bacterium]
MEHRDFLLELGFEELPALEIESIEKQFKNNLINILTEHGFKFSGYKTFSTPRRIAMLIYNLSSKGEDKLLEKIGPPANIAFDDNGPTLSAISFAKSIGVNIDELYIVEKEGKKYVAGKQRISGKHIKQVLSENLETIIKNIKVKKTMFWLKDQKVRFIRPMRWIVCLYEDEVVDIEIFNLKSDRYTYGHRILSNKKLEIKSPIEYEKILERNYVIADWERRYRKIIQDISDNLKVSVLPDENLYKEINGLVEYPFVVLCEFNSKYLELPEKIVITSMKSHQRYIPVFENGVIVNKFVAIINNKPNESIKSNLSKVLESRLEDAKFYFENDLKKPIISYLEDLREIEFVEGGGSLYDKVFRVEEMVYKFSKHYNLDMEKLKKAIRLYKNDRATSIIRESKEFAELEGYMVLEYLRKNSEDTYVINIIRDWLLEGEPLTIEGLILAIADRIDSIYTILKTGYTIRGNYDPLGLKKITYELFYAIIKGNLEFDISQIVDDKRFLEFIKQRLENYLIEKLNYEYDIVNSVLAINIWNINEIVKRVEFLNRYKKESYDEFYNIALTQKRLYNITKDYTYNNPVDVSLLQNDKERELYNVAKEIARKVDSLISSGEYEKLFTLFLLFKEHIDNFFNNVYVMVEDTQIRNNRLSLIKFTKSLFDKFADFSKIQL